MIGRVRRDIDLPHGTLRWRKTYEHVNDITKIDIIARLIIRKKGSLDNQMNFYFVIKAFKFAKSIS